MINIVFDKYNRLINEILCELIDCRTGSLAISSAWAHE
jgi:hypothetical protein